MYTYRQIYVLDLIYNKNKKQKQKQLNKQTWLKKHQRNQQRKVAQPNAEEEEEKVSPSTSTKY